MVFGAAVATLVLATVGATGGWALARADRTDPVNEAAPGATSTANPTPTKPPKTKPPTTSAPSGGKTATAPATPAGQFVLPDLVGQTFQRVRADLRERELGWRLVFGDEGEDPTVLRTEPAAGENVRKGTTVKIFVAGAAPLTAVPEVTGLSCSQAQAQLVDAGFELDYPSGRDGPVLRQEPEPGAQLRWNEKVTIYCGSVPTKSPGQPTPGAT